VWNGTGKEKNMTMSDKEIKLREELEAQTKIWVKEEFTRQYAVARETLERQGRESEEYVIQAGITEPSHFASETQMSISYAKSELYKGVQFEADKWIEEEVKKRLKQGE
jgi:hypothetical protein